MRIYCLSRLPELRHPLIRGVRRSTNADSKRGPPARIFAIMSVAREVQRRIRAEQSVPPVGAPFSDDRCQVASAVVPRPKSAYDERGLRRVRICLVVRIGKHGDGLPLRTKGVAASPVAILSLLLAVLTTGPLGGCAGLAGSIEAPPSGPDPSYNKLIGTHLSALFKDRAAYNSFEISDYRWVHTVKGWNWMACVRFLDHGHPRTYAVFVAGNKVVNSRYAVQIDDCGGPAYTPIDIGSGSMPVPGALAPVH
jgi:hypothetical protein